ncbi:MAG: trehalase family glycosidase [Candidatus Neomarinimicrobiota bacterium]
MQLPPNRSIRSFLFSLIVLAGWGCDTDQSSLVVTPEDFPNVLDIRNVPAGPDDWDSFCHSDQGAWFGFGLPPADDTQLIGSFTGPFLMSAGGWLAPSILRLSLVNQIDGTEIDLAQATDFMANYYPGRLEQSFRVNGLEVVLELIFADSATALVRLKIENTTTAGAEISISWRGSVFNGATVLEEQGTSLIIPVSETEKFQLQFPAEFQPAIATQGSSYQTRLGASDTLKPGADLETFVVLSLNGIKEKARVCSQSSVDAAFSANRKRWTHYLNSALVSTASWKDDQAYRQVAVKSLMTLINNWKCARGDLHHGGLFPSYAVWYFNGFWAWDSWKHAVALATFAPEIAKAQVRTMFDWQDAAGMVPDVIYADKTENNNRDTKPPLAAWAVWSIYESDQDRAFLAEMYPLLKKYHEWWYINRDVNKNGLCEYGSTDGTIEAARWESGMDNAIRFDSTKMLQTSATAWSMDQESVDLNAYLYAEKGYLAQIADVLQMPVDSNRWRTEANALRVLVQDKMFDREDGFFHDIRLVDDKSINPLGPEGWIPLWAELASTEQAAAVLAQMRDPGKFATFVPFPTVAVDSPEFSKGYWRGPVWLDQVYFAISAFQRYGSTAEVEGYTRQLFTNAEGLMRSTAPIRENYWPIDGRGMRVNHFSWSAAHTLLLYQGLDN